MNTENKSDNIIFLLQTATQKHQSGQWDEAESLYKQILQLSPGLENQYQAIASSNLGNIFEQQGNLDAAVESYQQALSFKPDYAEAYYNLGNVFLQQGFLGAAFESYQQALNINPNYAQADRNLQQDNLKEAISVYWQWLKLANPAYVKTVEAYSDSAVAQNEQTTPSILQTEVIVGGHRFPAIPPVSSEDKRPFWSVVIPVYKRRKYILACLASVLAQWTGFEDMEILVVDNASTPPLDELVNSLGRGVVRYYRHQQNIGLVGNFNAAIALSRGKWIHLLHDDDYVLPGFYSQLKQSLDGCSESIGAAFTGYKNINEIGEVIFSNQVYGEHKGIVEDWLLKIGVLNPLNPPAVVIRRLAYERLGGYHPELTFTTDWELYKRIAAFYHWWCEPEILACFRQHSQSKTTELLLSGAEFSSIRLAIEISEGYLGVEHCAKITTNARRHFFNRTLELAADFLKGGARVITLHVIQEALKIDRSSGAVANLFAWLKQDEAAPLRNEIAAKLISLELSDGIDMKTIAEAPQAVEQIEAQPNDPEALYSLGLQAQQNEKPQEAEKFFTAALQVQPSVKAWFSLGNLRYSQGQFTAAEIAYRQALALKPDLVAIHNNLGYTLQQLGRFEDAIACYQKSLEIQPKLTEAAVNLGNALHAQGKLSLEQQAHYCILNEQLGAARLEAGDLTTAIAYFTQAIVLQPSSVEAHYNLGVAREKLDHLEDAIACFVSVLELNPNYGEAYLNLGKIYQTQQQLQKAVAAYRQGLSLINPRYALAESGDRHTSPALIPVLDAIPFGEVVVGDFSFPAIPSVQNEQDKRPFWTVVIPVYKRTEYILNCLVNVLAQWTGEDEMEILVLDNASTPPLFELVNSLGRGVVRYVRQPQNLGVVRNLNTGLALSRGEWIHILHDDECVFPGFYSRLKQSLENCPQSVGAAFTGFKYINEKGENVGTGDIYGDNRGIAQDWLQLIGVCDLIAIPSVVVRRTTHEHLGGYCPELSGIDQWEMYNRIDVFYDCWYEPGILAGFRVHSHTETSQNWLSGSLPKSVRRAIEITSSYLPIECRAEMTAKSLRHYFYYCMKHATIPLKAGNLAATFRIIQEALKIDSSRETVAQLFNWLNQNQAVPVRDEIVSRLINW